MIFIHNYLFDVQFSMIDVISLSLNDEQAFDAENSQNFE